MALIAEEDGDSSDEDDGNKLASSDHEFSKPALKRPQ
jgi:hypothetical protein